jgi:hypothetical protein
MGGFGMKVKRNLFFGAPLLAIMGFAACTGVPEVQINVPGVSHSANTTLRIGWAQVDITPIPELGDRIFLQGSNEPRIATEVHDPLCATVLVMDDGAALPTVLVSMDIAFIPQVLTVTVRKLLQEAVPDLKSDSVILFATHSHTAPLLGDQFHDPDVKITPGEYIAFAAKKVASAVAEAWNNKAPGGIALKTGRIAVPQNRRAQMKDGTAAMLPPTNTPNFLRVEGMADTGVEYLMTYDLKGKLTGLAINMAAPAQVIQRNTYISADMWGEVRKQWPEIPYILPICGAAGDLMEYDQVRRDRTEPNTLLEAGDEALYEIGGRIIRESRYIVSSVKAENIWYEFPYDHVKKEIALIDARNAKKFIEIHVVRFHDAVLASNPFELYQEYGNQIKARSPAPWTFIAQLAVSCWVYLPNEIAAAGGYSGVPGSPEVPFGPPAGNTLVEETLKAIEAIW